MFKNVIWDWDGTILDNLTINYHITKKLANKQNIDFDLDTYRKLFKIPIQNFYEDLGFDFNIISYQDLVLDFHKEYSFTKKKVHENIVNILTQLKNKNINNYICSASSVEVIKSSNVYKDICNNIINVYAHDDLSGSCKKLLAKKLVKIENIDINHSYFIGDSYHDFEVANSIGVKCILISNGIENKESLKKADCLILNNLS